MVIESWNKVFAISIAAGTKRYLNLNAASLYRLHFTRVPTTTESIGAFLSQIDLSLGLNCARPLSKLRKIIECERLFMNVPLPAHNKRLYHIEVYNEL